MGMTAIFFNAAKPFEQIVNIPLTEDPMWTNCQYSFDRRPHVKSGENCSSSFKEEDI